MELRAHGRLLFGLETFSFTLQRGRVVSYLSGVSPNNSSQYLPRASRHYFSALVITSSVRFVGWNDPQDEQPNVLRVLKFAPACIFIMRCLHDGARVPRNVHWQYRY